MKRFMMLIVLLSLMISLFSFNVSAQQRVEIEFWYALSGSLGEIVENVVESFNASQELYTVRAVYKGSYTETMAAAIAAFRAGEAPQIVQVFEVGTGTMISAEEAIYPVDQLMADTGVMFDPEAYIAPVKGYYSFPDGRMAAMPFNSSTAVMWYNKDAFRQAGLDPENPPSTWQGVQDAARTIVDSGAAKNGMSAAWLTWTQFEQFASIHNIPFASRTNGFEEMDAVLALDHPLFIRHLQTLMEMNQDGSYIYGGRDSSPDALFPAGEVAMFFGSSAMLSRVKREAEFDWGIAYLPYYDDAIAEPKNSIIGGAALWVMKRPDATMDHYKGVAEFFRFISQPENDADWHIKTGYVPVTLQGYETAKLQGYYTENPGADLSILQLARPEPTGNTLGLRLGNLPAIRVVIYEEVEKALDGQQSAEQAMENVVRRGNVILREFEASYQ